jgi:hypothetical protein
MRPPGLGERTYRLTGWVGRHDLGTAAETPLTFQAAFKDSLLIGAVLSGDFREGGDC